MAIKIKIPTSAYHEQSITLNNESYNITFIFNTSDDSWYFNIADLDNNNLLCGIKVMPNQNLTGRFPHRSPFTTGDIWCFRRLEDSTPIGRDNLGIGKTYELWYLTEEEEIQVGIDDSIQL